MTPDEVKELMNKGLITQVIDPVDIVNNMETPPAGGCDCTEYVLPIAGTDVLGGVKIGSSIYIYSDSGTIEVGTATLEDLGGVKLGTYLSNNFAPIGIDNLTGEIGLNYGTGLAVDNYGRLYASPTNINVSLPVASDTTLGGVKVSNDNGLVIDTDGKLKVNVDTGAGLGINASGALAVNIGTGGNGLTIYPDGSLGVNFGTGLAIGGDEKLYVTGGGSNYQLPKASDKTLGGVKVGTSIGINGNNYAPIGINYSTGEIGLNYGTGLAVDDNGKLYVTSGFFPTATKKILGGVKIGTTLTIDNYGVIETKFPSKSGMQYENGGNGYEEGWYINCGNGIIINTTYNRIELDIDYIYEQFVQKGYLKVE